MLSRSSLCFYLNDQLIELKDVSPHQTVLDWLRLDQQMRGTKEGCAEGDCGACTVLVGRLTADDELIYETINSCIRLLVSLDGTHLVTIEDLAEDGKLHPVQKAMVDCHASQCGFCTPGVVMSLYGSWLDNPHPTTSDIEHSLQGNLCRCTGYEAILRAARMAATLGDSRNDRINADRDSMATRLRALRAAPPLVLRSGDCTAFFPATADELADILMDEPEALLASGATDVGLWITKDLRQPKTMVFLQHARELEGISIGEDHLVIGARASYSAAQTLMGQHFPTISELWLRIGGQQVRNAGTIGGNIANGSPIGDMPPLLMVLGASLNLRRGPDRRSIPIEDFFIDYGKQDLRPGEFIESITVPLLRPSDLLRVYKVSKRYEEDISSVLGAFRVRLEDGRVAEAIIAYGGMAATPKRARSVEAALVGRPWTRQTVEAAMALYAETFSPLTDWRATAQYRRLVARNLLLRFWSESEERPSSRARELTHG